VRKIRSAISVLGYVSHTTGEVSCYRIIEAFDLGWKFHLTDIIFMFACKFVCRLFQIINWLRTLSVTKQKAKIGSYFAHTFEPPLSLWKKRITYFLYIHSKLHFSISIFLSLNFCFIALFATKVCISILVETPLAIERYSDTLKNVYLNAPRVDFKPSKASSHRPNSSSCFALQR
jgi:hypothetical protein